MANVTYKHLEGKTALGVFSLGQWVQLIAGVVMGLLFGVYLSPLPPVPTIFVSCLLPGLPLAASYGAMGLEFSVRDAVLAAWRHWRRPRRYLPGSGEIGSGYVVLPDRDAADAVVDERPANDRDLETLWDV